MKGQILHSGEVRHLQEYNEVIVIRPVKQSRDRESQYNYYGKTSSCVWWGAVENPYSSKNLLITGVQVNCPLGQIGERRFVKETWREADNLIDGYTRDLPYYVQYKDGSVYHISTNQATRKETLRLHGNDYSQSNKFGKWRSSQTMPQWASRYEIELAECDVMRLQDVGKESLMQSFIRYSEDLTKESNRITLSYDWNKQYPKYPYESNLLVWVGRYITEDE